MNIDVWSRIKISGFGSVTRNCKPKKEKGSEGNDSHMKDKQEPVKL